MILRGFAIHLLLTNILPADPKYPHQLHPQSTRVTPSSHPTDLLTEKLFPTRRAITTGLDPLKRQYTVLGLSKQPR